MSKIFRRLFCLSVALLVLLQSPVRADYAKRTEAQYVFLDTSEFDNNLSSSDFNLQIALETLDEMVGGGGGGETNTASNLGGGLANFSAKVGVDLRFNSFSADDFDLNSNLFTIDASIARDAEVAAAYQPLDSDLTYLAGFTLSDDVKTILNAADNDAVLAALGLVIGLDIQAWDADLDIWAGKTAPSGTVVGDSDSQELTNKTLTDSVAKGTWTASGTWTLPAFTVGGLVTLGANILMGENTEILLDAALSADGKYCGITEDGTAGTALAFGDVVYLAAADSRWELADADAESTAGPVKIGIVVLAAAGDGSATKILLRGKIRADANFPALTISAPVYVSTTAGDLQVAQPSGTDDVVRILGHANTADELDWNPARDYWTHT
jgi:hypothetical protein